MRRAGRRRATKRVAGLGAALVLAALPIVAAPAHADTAPPVANDPANPPTVAVDTLPTTQINGVAWSQTIIGNTVYVGGQFTNARPAGSPAGTNTVSRSNLLAYDIGTGELLNSWAPTTNGTVDVITRSPDGSRIYIGGSFTQVNGVTRNRIAALSPSTGALVQGWTVNSDARVRAIAPTSSTVYFGGLVTSVNGAARSRLAAVRASDGGLLPWAPVAAGGTVTALVASPDGGKVVAGGSFTTMNGSDNPGYGMAALDPVTGASLPWAANATIRNGGPNASVTSMSSDADSVYVTGYVFGTGGNLEGTARMSWTDGSVTWLEDCHGDTYGAYPVGDVVYTVSHAHYCGNLPGGYAEVNPRYHRHALAFSKRTTQRLLQDNLGYPNWLDVPAPSLLEWFPLLTNGTFTGQSQAAWTVSGNADYVVAGGEFPTAGGVAQQGLVRYARRALAPNDVGPVVSGANANPRVTSPAAGTALVTWQTNFDRDNHDLTYRVMRDGNPVHTRTVGSNEWTRPYQAFLDTGLTPGATVNYRIFATDPLGNESRSDTVPVTVSGSGTVDGYAQSVLADGPMHFWRFNEGSGTTIGDYTGLDGLDITGSVTLGQSGAIAGNSAASFPGTSSTTAANNTLRAATQAVSVEAWFQTTTTRGGRIVGFGNARTGTSGSATADRQLYMLNDGRLSLGARANTSNRTITTGPSYNDGNWHHVVGTIGDNGMILFVDGLKVTSRVDTRTGASYDGYWRVGGDNLSGWPNRPTSDYFAGRIDEVAIYRTPLTGNQVRAHYTASGRTVAGPAMPADGYGRAVYDDGPEAYWRLAETSGALANDSSLNGHTGQYANGTAQGGPSALGLAGDRSATFDGSNDVVASNPASQAPNVYSAEVWFRTTTSNGGRLFGFSSARTGSSASADRQVYMTNSGRLRFGVAPGGNRTTIESAGSYNDGAWHQAVITQGTAGMLLYVDGELVASGDQVAAGTYVGYWRLGGDSLSGWPSRPTSDYFSGSLDEASVYFRALSAAEVLDQFTASGGVLVNDPPVAAFTSTTDDLTASFDGSTSVDPDGTIVGRSWSFGDGATGSGTNPSHTYASAGTYTVTLTVTDEEGGTGSVTHPVTVAITPNVPPTAAFSSSATGLAASFDSSASTDSDGTIVQRGWDFGDGTTGSGISPNHTYAAAGTYTVTLTVTDDEAGTDSVAHDITVADLPNVPPTAEFTSTVNSLTINFTSTVSSDPDGTIVQRDWDFGDGTTGTGTSPSHTYAVAGTYDVTLTVTDNDGATGTVTHQVSPTDAPASLVEDLFGRTVTGGWGSADTGGPWTLNGSSSFFNVNGGTGAISMTSAGAGPRATLASVSVLASETRVQFQVDKLANSGGVYLSLGTRTIGNSSYRTKVKIDPTGLVTIYLVRVDAAETTLSSVLLAATASYAVGEVWTIRMQTEGTSPTTLRAKTWEVGTAEPAAWQVTATDSTAAFQAAGGFTLMTYLAGSATNAPIVGRFDELRATALP